MNPQSNRMLLRTLFEAILFVLLVATLAVIFRYFSIPAGPEAASTSPLLTPTSSSPLATPTPTFNAWAATKQAANATEQARPTRDLTSQPTTLKPTPFGVGSETPAPTGYLPIPGSTPAGAGAIVQVQPPFSGTEYHIENDWYEDVEGDSRRIFVYAGSVSGPGGEVTGQGVVVVWVWQMSGVTETGSYLTPVVAGSVHIVGAVGARLILQSAGGSTFYFDVPTRQYVPSLEATSTPPPQVATPLP